MIRTPNRGQQGRGWEFERLLRDHFTGWIGGGAGIPLPPAPIIVPTGAACEFVVGDDPHPIVESVMPRINKANDAHRKSMVFLNRSI
jgi:hypothetical protein